MASSDGCQNIVNVLLHLAAAAAATGHGGWSHGHGSTGLASKDGRFFRNRCFLRGELDALTIVDRDVVRIHLCLLNLDVSLATLTNPRQPGRVRWSGQFRNGLFLLQALLCLRCQVMLESLQHLVLFLIGERR